VVQLVQVLYRCTGVVQFYTGAGILQGYRIGTGVQQ
jgi:hypothetical protein